MKLDSGIGSLMLLAFSTVALASAVSIPALISIHSYLSIRNFWTASQGLFGFSMLATFIIRSTIGTIWLFSIIGFSWAASVWIPFTLLGAEISARSSSNPGVVSAMEDLLDEEKTYHVRNEHGDIEDLASRQGLVYGLHNFSICLPQMLITLGMGLHSMLSAAKGSGYAEQDDQIVWSLRLGGLFALVAMFLTTGIRNS